MFMEFAKVAAIVAAGMVGIVSIGNALGRVFWAWASDFLGRRWTFAVMYILQIALFWFLPSLHVVGVITAVSFVILMCYGGGFGTMPAFAADYFGPANVGSIYGLMLTAWGFASAFGPLLIAHMRQASGNYTTGLHVIAGIMLVSVIVPLLVRPPAKTAAA
jgi:OFA family oxalate/formate antiporter-like MFS transporter